MTGAQFAILFQREIGKIAREIQAYKNEDDIWIVAEGIGNSGGNLAQHLVGNLSTYISKALGGFEYTRDRDAEFGKRLFTREELIGRLNDTSAQVGDSLQRLDEALLAAPYPRDVLVMEGCDNVGLVLLHLLSHLSYHLGQINYHRRLLSF